MTASVHSRSLRVSAISARSAFPLTAIALALLAAPWQRAHAEEAPATLDAPAPSRQSGVVVITGSQPSSLPTRIPTTIEGVSAAQIAETINATDAEDALKYLPSLLVRKRYVGDYNHAVLSTRASGTGNSARSLVYADGVLLSNLLGNGATFTPRWGLVTPEEIDRVDVLYGPFSAAYPGNAVGAVVDYVTGSPKAFEAHAKLSYSSQPNDLYGQKRTYHAGQASASLGGREGDFGWFVSANRTDSVGQPLVFSNKLLSAGAALKGGETVVSGAVAGQNPRNADWWLIGSATQYDTVQDQVKAKLIWDITPTLRANYLVGLWQNTSDGSSQSWLRDSAGAVVNNTYGGDITQAVNINGKRYTLAASDFSQTHEDLSHVMHALSLKSRTRGVVDWEVAASVYNYDTDRARALAPTSKAAANAGRITDQAGTGWRTLSAKGTWRPEGEQGAHVVDGGFGQDTYQLRTRVDTTADWRQGAPAAFASLFAGNTGTRSAWAQDTWRFAPDWAAVIGVRAEQWRAWGGVTQATTGQIDHPERSKTSVSPKLALSRALSDEWVLKASTGRAVRFPTVSELYQGGVNTLGQAINNNPDLRPERGWTSELTAEWTGALGNLRSTLFHEDTRDALYSQLNPATNANTVQNINHVRTTGLEFSAGSDKLVRDLTLKASLTFADSIIVANDGYQVTSGDTVGKWQPRVPRWRATMVATWQMTPALATTLGVRYSGRQYSALDNLDTNAFAYTGASRYLTGDVRVRWQASRQWSAAFGIDNLNNQQYWNFHPYPQRSYSAELKFDL
ncbi:MAG: TonB-dependent receptor [Burkholderiales bacterium PBB6]|nr:MAG: TonB-dependent receptor [Burkholderiales bacterium PBB6]